MEMACSLDAVSLSLGFRSTIPLKQAYKTRNSSVNYLYCNDTFSVPSAFLSCPNRKLSYPSSSSSLCHLDVGSSGNHLAAALNTSSYSLAIAKKVDAPFIHNSVVIIFSLVGCKHAISRARIGSCSFSSSLNGAVCCDGEGANGVHYDTSPFYRRQMMVMKIRRFPIAVEQKGRNCRVRCVARGHGIGSRIPAKQIPQRSCVVLLGAGEDVARGNRLQFCKATGGQGSTGQPVPEEENPEPAPEQGPPDLQIVSPDDSDPPEVDWRTFRARLVVTEQTTGSDESGTTSSNEEETRNTAAYAIGARWAHPILAPEAGCVLIATDKIDGQQSFERSVILLLSPGSSNPREGPYGLILNRPLSCRIKDIRPKDRSLVNFFGNCQVHHGGPLDEDMFLVLHGTPEVKGYREVIPGVYYGAAAGLVEIMKGKHLLDYRFFFGYSGWGVEQLKKEIDAGLWCVAACSTDLITGHSAAGLWEEILLLMGGKYGELSKRPRRRHF